MKQGQKKIYKIFAQTFIVLGVMFIGVEVAQEIFDFSFLKGSPFPVAAFLIGIGAVLLWTVKQTHTQDDDSKNE